MPPEQQAQIINALIINAPTIITAIIGAITTVFALFTTPPKKKAKAKEQTGKGVKW